MCKPKKVASLLIAARDLGGGTASARRRRERRQRPWWRHEQLSVVAALASARHHSAGPGVVSRREEQQEEVENSTYDGLRAQNTPSPGTRPGVLQDPGPPWVEAVTVGYVAAAPPSLVVSLVAEHDNVDQATVQFLLQQSLLAHAEEEEKAREEAEVKELEEKVDRMMEQLAEKVREVARRDGFRLSPNLSVLERTACALVGHSEILRKKEKRKKRKKRRRRIRNRSGFLVSCSS